MKTRSTLAVCCLFALVVSRPVAARTGVRFEHGVASGDPLSDAVILWTRVTPEKRGRVRVRWEVAEEESFASLTRSGEQVASARSDYTVKVDADGLLPGRTYFYRFLVGEAVSPVGRTRTLPVGPVDRLDFAVVSCSNYPQGYFNVYRAIAEQEEIDAVLHLGDYLYEFERGVYSSGQAPEMGRESFPEGELLTLADYRLRHAQYKADPDSRELHRRFPFITVWDDHEFANNAWRSGAENHGAGEGGWTRRRAAAVRAYLEWMPIRPARGRDARGKIYRSFELGDLASLIMLDTRLVGRDEQMSYGDRLEKDITTPEAARRFLEEELGDPSRSILGAEQEAWLAARLRESKARGVPWQIVGQQLLVAPTPVPELEGLEIVEGRDSPSTVAWIEYLKRLRGLGLPWNLDAWDGYPAARRRFYRSVEENANNLVVLSGDTHNAWAFHLMSEDGSRVHGVELATPGVTSPGMEDYLPLEPEKLLASTYASVPHLVYGNGTDRGYMLLGVTPDQVRAEWRFVDTILSRDFDVRCEKALPSARGHRRAGHGPASGDLLRGGVTSTYNAPLMSVRSEKNGPVTTVILTRPEVRNAVDRETAQALADAFREFESDTEARVAVLWGEGGHFCAGADLKVISEGEVGERGNRVEPEGDAPMGPTRMLLRKPVIAAVAGYAVAGGLELALWCDLRVVEETATFGVFCRRFGVPLVDGGTVRLPRLIGMSRALDLILTGRGVDAREAMEIGLANRRVPEGQSRAAAEDLARAIAAHPQICLRNDRRSVYAGEGLALEEALAYELRCGVETLRSGESVAGARRFADGQGRHGSFD